MRFGLRVILIIAALVVILAIWFSYRCPASGLALSPGRRDFHRLKNRRFLPQPSDFDSRVNLQQLLQPGADQSRWSTSRAARLDGYVVSVTAGPLELVNCFCRRDTHINVALRPQAPARETVVLEVTPPIRDLITETNHGALELLSDWSTETLEKQLTGRWVRFEGWLFFDGQHESEAENTAPGRDANWRATAWELHPVTRVEVIK
ncbi:MAG TPA: hypothetical protein VIW64_05360 [Pyrinomonadaceae bacterium]|jgi:hypothetical protein